MAPYTILYVDDEPDLLVLGKTFLESKGDVLVDTKESARAGLEALHTRHYDLVISDYLMPDMDGLIFLKQVRADFGDLPFILFTGRGREAVIIEAINNGVDFYLQKGGDVRAQFAELSHKIKMAVGRKRAVDELIESEKRLSSIFHASPIHQMITESSSGRILDINDRFLRDLRLTRPEVVEKTLEDIGLVPEPRQYSSILHQLERDGMVRNAELFVHARNGRTYHTLTSLTLVRVHQQDLIYTQSMDITVQKKAQQTINALLNAPPDVSMLLDPHGTILAANEAASERYGTLLENLIGANAFTLLSPIFANLREQKVAEVLTTGKPLTYTDDRTGKTYENRLYPVAGHDGEVTAVAVHSHDITEERMAKEALKESEEKYRLVVEHSHDTIYIYRDNRFLFINHQAEQLTGFSHEELMRRDIWDFIHPDDRERLKVAAQKRFAGGHITSAFEARILRKDNKVLEGEFYVDLVDFQGKPAILGIARDITEKKRAETALRESELRYRMILDNLQDAYFRTDLSGQVVMASPSAARMYGYDSAEEMNGIPVQSLYRFPNARENIMAILKTEGRVVDYTGQAVRKDGTIFWVSINVQYYRDENGKILGTEGIVRDTSERKEVEEALRTREEDYRLIIENIQDVFYRVNREGIISMISPYGARLVGFDTPADIIGKYRATEFYADPHERDAFLSLLYREGKVSGYPLNLRDRHGNLHHATASSRLLYDSEGKPGGIEGILHDVTHLKKVENALRQANRQITLMSNITRHDIRNQLMALDGWLELSRASVADPDRMLELITREQQITSVIGEQINFTAFFDEMGTTTPVWQDPVQLLRKSESALPFRGLDLTIECEGIEIFADPLFEKVFYNLFDNALRYGGETMTWIHVTAFPDKRDLVLTVEDNGKGIAEKDKKHLFERGFGNNTGLGLFQVREILSITDITIRETGTFGKGARFEIRIPQGGFRKKPGVYQTGNTISGQ
jgi:PAS domain S-box-containing protein